MKRKQFFIIMSILLAIIAALAVADICAADGNTWDVCYEMTDRYVEWSGAGYSGIYGGGA